MSSSSWAQLRQQARSLETQTETLFHTYSQHAFLTTPTPSPTREELSTESSIESLLERREALITQLSALLTSSPSQAQSALKSTTLARHREVLAEHRAEFRRLQSNITSARQRANLLSSVRSDISAYRQSQPEAAEAEYMLAERSRIDNSHNVADSVLSQAYAVNESFGLQRESLANINRRIVGAASQLPGINGLMNRISSKRRRDGYDLAVMRLRESPFDLQTCARPNILALEPYRCARDDYKDDGTNILLDANENAYGPGLALESDRKLANSLSNGDDLDGRLDVDLLGLNRYPDPHQIELKQQFCDLRSTNPRIQSSPTLTPANLFLGVGSDEVIDALIRAFCVPGRDKILTCPPTYGMYAVSAQTNDISLHRVPLIPPTFTLDVHAILSALSSMPAIKLCYFCSPGNPTGQLLSRTEIEAILAHPSWNGVVVVDEAYVDFSPPGSSLTDLVTAHPNLIVMQTLSKAFGLAGIRLGAAFTSPEIAKLLNSLKAPYNISNPTSQLARAALAPKHRAVMQCNVAHILAQRDRMLEALPKIPGIGDFLGGIDANFLLVQILDRPRDEGGKPCNATALAVYTQLAERRGVVVRFRGKEFGCNGCLRITIGTESEVGRFLAELERVLADVLREGKERLEGQDSKCDREEARREDEESAVVA